VSIKGGKSGVNNDDLRNWYLALKDPDKQVFLALVSNHLTIHGRGFYRYLPGTEPKAKAFQAFEGLNESGLGLSDRSTWRTTQRDCLSLVPNQQRSS